MRSNYVKEALNDKGKKFSYFEVPVNHKLQRMDEFRKAAIHFMKYGRYTNLTPGTVAYRAFWIEEARRCVEGLDLGFDKIPGYYYFYLNYCPIIKVEAVDEDKSIVSDFIKAERVRGFPDVWKADYDFFWYVEEAENHGLFGVVVKGRGQGYSLKASSMLARNYYLIKESNSYAIANDEPYLLGDALMDKTWDNLNFIDEFTPWGKRRQVKDESLHKKASYKENVDGKWVEKGFKSEIIGIVLANNPNKVRGKRGKIIMYEESGSNPVLKKSWIINIPSMRQNKMVYGFMLAFGTGGDDRGHYEALEEMFYNPFSSFIFPVRNIYDEGLEDTYCGFFSSSATTVDDAMDKDGNYDLVLGASLINEERDIVRQSGDIVKINKTICEKPLVPKEAFLKTGDSYFLKPELVMWERTLSTDPAYKNLGVTGRFRGTGGNISFEADSSLKPIIKFPIKSSEDRTGCPVIWESPYKNANGEVPEHLYYAVLDPYNLDTNNAESLAAFYIFKKINSFSKPDDICVMSYVGRPSFQDDFYKQVFDACEYYNCKVCPENDAFVGFLTYARHNNKTHLLKEEFTILNKSGKQSNLLGRSFGISMNDVHRKREAAQKLKEWLYTSKTTDEDGNHKYNFQFIYDVGLIRELIKFIWDKKANFDRISAWLIAMLYKDEIYKIDVDESNSEHWSKSDFWTRN